MDMEFEFEYQKCFKHFEEISSWVYILKVDMEGQRNLFVSKMIQNTKFRYADGERKSFFYCTFFSTSHRKTVELVSLLVCLNFELRCQYFLPNFIKFFDKKNKIIYGFCSNLLIFYFYLEIWKKIKKIVLHFFLFLIFCRLKHNWKLCTFVKKIILELKQPKLFRKQERILKIG